MQLNLVSVAPPTARPRAQPSSRDDWNAAPATGHSSKTPRRFARGGSSSTPVDAPKPQKWSASAPSHTSTSESTQPKKKKSSKARDSGENDTSTSTGSTSAGSAASAASAASASASAPPAQHQTSSLFTKNPEIDLSLLLRDSISATDVADDDPDRPSRVRRRRDFTAGSFDGVGLHPHLVSVLRNNLGLSAPTTCQRLAIPPVLVGRDVLVRSETGSGKTLAYMIPVLQKLQAIEPAVSRADGPLAIILVPTRELAQQIMQVCVQLLRPFVRLVAGAVTGGEKRKSEKARLRKGINILIATPGRLLDHIMHTRAVQLERLRFLVLDEADRLTDMGFDKDVSAIVEAIRQAKEHRFGAKLQQRAQRKRVHTEFDEDENDEAEEGDGDEDEAESAHERHHQTLLLSATMPPETQRLAGLILRNPERIEASTTATDAEGDRATGETEGEAEGETTTGAHVMPEQLEQEYYVVPAKLRLVMLCALVQRERTGKTIVFMSSRDTVEFYAQLMTRLRKGRYGFEGATGSAMAVYALHGNMAQSERLRVFRAFGGAQSGVLLCTDVAARGLDLPDVQLIVQFMPAIDVEGYVHRCGRTARRGQGGRAVVVLMPHEVGEYVAMLMASGLTGVKGSAYESVLKECVVPSDAKTTKQKGESKGDASHDARMWQDWASDMQDGCERLVAEDVELHGLACAAYTSFIRGYASYPSRLKKAFHVRLLHLGHVAKSFALRETPTEGIASMDSAKLKRKEHDKTPLSHEERIIAGKRRRLATDGSDQHHAGPSDGVGRKRRLEIDEFSAGPQKQKKSRVKLRI